MKTIKAAKNNRTRRPVTPVTRRLHPFFAWRCLSVLIRALVLPLEAPTPEPKNKRNVVLLTYHTYSKGCQSLLLCAMDIIRQRCPDKKIHVFIFSKNETVDKDIHAAFRLWRLPQKINVLYDARDRATVRYKNILADTALMIDVSGSMFSSYWGFAPPLSFLLNMVVAKRYAIPFVLMPHAFGPLQFKRRERLLMTPLMKKYLPSAGKLFIREKENYEGAGNVAYLKNNIEFHRDLVLASPMPEPARVFKDGKPDKQENLVPLSGVALVPNVRLEERIEKTKLENLFVKIIDKLIALNKKVHLLAHDVRDYGLYNTLADRYSHNGYVHCVPDIRHSLDMVRVLGEFDFVITARFHALVHAMKSHVPAIAISWENKFKNLQQEIGLERFVFDIRDGIVEEDILDAVEEMNMHCPAYRSDIEAYLNNLDNEKIKSAVYKYLP